MKWWPWHRHEPDGEHARETEAEARAQLDRARRQTTPQVQRVVQATQDRIRQADQFARAIEETMRLRGTR